MRTFTPEQLKEIIESHGRWLLDSTKGKKADLRDSDLSYSNLSGSNLSYGNLSYSNLRGSNLSGSNLSGSDLSGSDLSYSNLSGSNLSYSNLRGSDLSGSNLSYSNLRGSNLSYSNLRGSDLSGVKGFPDHTKQFDFLSKLERTAEGYICYKTFGEKCKAPDNWKIEEGSIIEEFTDMSMFQTSSHGINVATFDWVKRETRGDIWKCLIKFEWLIGAVIPFYTDGNFRASRVQLLENIGRG